METSTWLKTCQSLQRGVAVISRLEDTKLEQFLRRIVSKMKLQDTDIFTVEEKQKLEKIFKVNEETLMLAIKTVVYLFKRMLKYIFMPMDLKNDLNNLGFSEEKADCFIKVWSLETKNALNELGSDATENNKDTLQFSWKLNAELSSEYRKKYKVPKAYLSIAGNDTESQVEMTHSELHAMFLQLEAIQNELDNII